MATEAPKSQPEQDKKKRHRSPNYPAVGLREAIDRLRKFVSADGKAGATTELAAKHIGFTSAHGWAYSVLSALKKFGLVEERDGRVVPTHRGNEILSLPANDERRRAAIRQAACSPSIYAELIEQYRSTGLPSDDTLEGELKAYKGFNPNTVKDFLADFKDTLELSGLSRLGMLYSESELAGEGGKSEVLAGVPDLQSALDVGTGTTKAGTMTIRQDVFSVAEGEVILRWPTPLSEDSIADVKDWLKIVERKIARSSTQVAATVPDGES